tara:strand:+ start:1814 stop:1996 length:183 start_codon:yes stop_codon:yes gene_type:complete
MIDLFEKEPRDQERSENAFATLTLICPGALKLGVIGGKAKKEPSNSVNSTAVTVVLVVVL